MIQKLGSGSFASCYLRNDGKAIKIYNNNASIKAYSKRFIGLKNDTYIFPDEIIYSDNEPIAYLMNYINSKPISKKNNNYNDLINGVNKVYSDTDLLSDLGIVTMDVRPDNILYDDSYKIIDTDFYYFNDESKLLKQNYFSEDELKSSNIAEFNNGIYQLLFDLDDFYFYLNLSDNDVLCDLYKQLLFSSDNRVLKEFLLGIKHQLENINNKEIKTVKDFKKYLIK